MKRWVLLFLLFLAACAPPEVKPEEPQEKIVEKVVEKVVVQCWDGSTAESVEQCPPQPEPEEEVEEPVEEVVEEVVAQKPPETVAIASKLLQEAKSKFTGHAYLLDNRMVIVYGNKLRHLFLEHPFELKDRTPITDVYVDLDAQTAVAYCNVEREGRMMENSFEWERSKCRDYLDKEIPVPFADWMPKGPMEYLEDFANLEPILVENNVQTVSIGGTSKTVQPSLHYMVDGKRIVLRIDKRYQVPIKVEVEGQQAVDFRDTYFDVMVLYEKQEKIDPFWVEYRPVSEYWKAAASK